MACEVISRVERRRRWPTAEKLRIMSEALEPGATVAAVSRPAKTQRGRPDTSVSNRPGWRVRIWFLVSQPLAARNWDCDVATHHVLPAGHARPASTASGVFPVIS